MRKLFTVITVLTLSIFLVSCSGSTSGGVGSSTSGLYRGTVSYSGYNTCGRNIPGSGTVEIVITSSGDFVYDPIGLTWGGGYGQVTCEGCVSGSTIKATITGSKSGYQYRIDARIKDDGATVSGTGYIEGNYGGCYEKFQGAFAATRVG